MPETRRDRNSVALLVFAVISEVDGAKEKGRCGRWRCVAATCGRALSARGAVARDEAKHSARNNVEARIQAVKVIGIARQDTKLMLPSNDDHRGVDDVGGSREAAELAGRSRGSIVQRGHADKR